MNVELKRIAEKKLEQLGGDVCGVLVRKDGKLAAVDEHGRVQWLRKAEEAEEAEAKCRVLIAMCRDLRARVTELERLKTLLSTSTTPRVMGGLSAARGCRLKRIGMFGCTFEITALAKTCGGGTTTSAFTAKPTGCPPASSAHNHRRRASDA